MSSIGVQQEIFIDAPPRTCFHWFADVTSYPRWEPSARQAKVLQEDQDQHTLRVEFKFHKKVLFYTYRLNYSLRYNLYESGERFRIKFDQPKGDLHKLVTVVDFEPHQGRTRMAYQGIFDDQAVVRRAFVAFFGPRELQSHLERFRDFVHRAPVARSREVWDSAAPSEAVGAEFRGPKALDWSSLSSEVAAAESRG